jgi:hypothetical protein
VIHAFTARADPLEDFLRWFLAQAPVIGYVPHDSPMHMIDGMTAVTLYRKGEFQVQMFITPPGYIVPEHTHPNVDSFEVNVGGHIRFSHKGRWTQQDPSVIDRKTADGTSFCRGNTVRVRPTDPHGGVSGPNGAIFLSVQRWMNGVKPTCVGNDYVGAVTGPEHLARITHGKGVLKNALSMRDAASAEA